MAEPVTIPFTVEPDDLAQVGIDYLQGVYPAWQPARADSMTWTLRSVAQIIAEAQETSSDVPTSIYRYLGRWLVGLPPIDATSAQTQATVTMVDTAGYTIDAGTRFLIKTSGDAGVVFLATGPVTVPPGSGATAAGELQLIAEEPGAHGTGLASSLEVQPVDALAFIDTVTLTADTTGGVDAETDDEYLARFTAELALMSPRPILPDDFAVLARRVAGVARALAVDGYNPADDTLLNERMVTVAVADETGGDLSAGIKTAVDALLQGMREVNFVVHVIDPTRTTFDVRYTAVSYPGFDTASVQAAVDAAVAGYLSGASWGTPPIGEAATVEWLDNPVVRYLELAEQINRTEGLHYITSLLFGARQAVTGVAATDVLTSTAHGFVADQPVVFSGLTGGAPLVAGTTYYARDITTDTFKVAATAGGAAINLTTDLTVGMVAGLATADVTMDGPAALPVTGSASGTVSAP
jgi:hypothetical protein